jgi:phosphatidate cytidylyltransferase
VRNPRLVYGPVFLASLVGLVWLDEWLDARALPGSVPAWLTPGPTVPPGIIIFIACLVLSILAAREMAAILRAKEIAASTRVMCGASALGLTVSCMLPAQLPPQTAVGIVSVASVAVLLASLAFFSRHKTTQGVIAATGGVLLAYVYLGLALGFVPAIRREHSAWILLWIIAVTKFCDIGAYFTGKAIGKHKLIVWLSPGKTWEGLFGGIVFAAAAGAVGVLLLRHFGVLPPAGASADLTHLTVMTGAITGVIFAIVGQTGDLVASMLKRDAGKKDSSSLLPGFGGILDVLDSPLLVAPVAYWWLKVLSSGA